MDGKAAVVIVAGLTLVLAAAVVFQEPEKPPPIPVTTTPRPIQAAAIPVQPKPLSPIQIELRQYYADTHVVPIRWTQAWYSLRSEDESLRQESATYLTALLSQALADEQSGSAPWRALPFWGGGSENPARELRKNCLYEITQLPATNAEAISLLDWYLQHEIQPRSQLGAADELCEIDDPQVDEILSKNIRRPHANTEVLVKLIDRAAERNLDIEQDRLAPLCLNLRQNVRNAARKLNSQLGYLDPGPFDPVAAIQRAEFRGLMQQMSEYILEPAPPNARLVKVTETTQYNRGKPSTSTHIGWVISETRNPPVLVLQTPHGWRESFPIDDQPWIDEHGVKHKISVQDHSLEEEIARIVKLRKAGNPEHRLSEFGLATGQFEGPVASLYEILFGEWLYRSRRFESAAGILLPALETFYEDHELAELVKHRLGQNYGYRMLAAFAGDRDYDETLCWAKVLSERFPETQFHNYATRLVSQIPNRRDDFKTLTLPTPDEWASLQTKLDHREQIDYLCRRIRLLNCFQWGQPGAVSTNSPQYAEPSGISRNATWGRSGGKTPVINPLEELTGQSIWQRKTATQPNALRVTVADLPQLAEYLREDRFILAVSFWRDFHPSRTLKTTREVFGSLINKIARQNLCNVSSLNRMDPEQIEEQITRIVAWSRQHSSLTETDLLLNSLETNLAKQGGRWHDIREQAYRLSELRAKAAVPLLRKFLVEDSFSKHNFPEILRCCRLIDVASVQDLGQAYLDRPEIGIRLQAALIALKGDDPAAARRVLGQALQEANEDNVYVNHVYDAVVELMDEKTPESKATALKIFDGLGLATFSATGRSRPKIVRHFASLGDPAGYEYYLKLLELREKKLMKRSYSGPIAYTFAWEVVYELAPDDPELIKLRESAKDDSEKCVTGVRAWLQEQIRNLREPQ